MKIADENGMPITLEAAKDLIGGHCATKELDDEELDNAAGGCGSLPPYPDYVYTNRKCPNREYLRTCRDCGESDGRCTCRGFSPIYAGFCRDCYYSHPNDDRFCRRPGVKSSTEFTPGIFDTDM